LESLLIVGLNFFKLIPEPGIKIVCFLGSLVILISFSLSSLF